MSIDSGGRSPSRFLSQLGIRRAHVQRELAPKVRDRAPAATRAGPVSFAATRSRSHCVSSLYRSIHSRQPRSANRLGLQVAKAVDEFARDGLLAMLGALEQTRERGVDLARRHRLDEVAVERRADGLGHRRVFFALRDHDDRADSGRPRAARASASRPCLPGICSSSRTRLNGRRRTISTASSALVAVSTSNPLSRKNMR